MTQVTIKNVRKSLKEQEEALKEMFLLFPNSVYELGCNSFNGREYTNFEVDVKLEDFACIAVDYHIKADSLFDFFRPQIIETGSWTWNSTFVEVRFFWNGKYNFYSTDYKEPQHAMTTKIILQSRKLCCGLKNWKKDYLYLSSFMEKNPNGELVKRYCEKFQSINDQVEKWEIAIQEVGNLKL